MNYENQSAKTIGFPKGQYANYFKVGQNALEFLLDFGQRYSGEENEDACIHSRIITNPSSAKALLATLWHAIKRHEQMFGPIEDGFDCEEENEIQRE
jgi:hypothetical protein